MEANKWNNQAMNSEFVEVDGLRLHYRTHGEGDPVLLLHGWPTSSYLWRHVMEPMNGNRVIALDLPGFGQSDKPLDASYSFRFYEKLLNNLLEVLGIERIGLAVHDLGGPVGLYWACRNPERLSRLALLNTIVYPQMSWAVVAFVTACKAPILRTFMSSPAGLHFAMRYGVTRSLDKEVIRAVQEPFKSQDARRALLKAGGSLHPKGFVTIAKRLPDLEIPVRIIYGERDRILPDVAKTMARVKKDLPQAEITSFNDCGHFLQEQRGEEIGRLLNEFFAA